MEKYSNKQQGSNQTRETTNSLPQYGKKGHKPRYVKERGSQNLDDIHTNDISYWNKTSGFKNVTALNWDLIVGNARKPDFVSRNLVKPDSEYNPPQVMALNFIMGPGWANTVNDGVNRSLAKIMAKIRATLSTSQLGFETADLGIFFAATSSIAAMIGFAKRILESYNVWNDRNYVYPRALINAQGYDYYDIRDNINTYSAQLNSIIDMYNNMSIIDCWDIYDRQYSMCHSIFVDEDSAFGQLYIFNPVNYYVYNDMGEEASVAVSTNNYILPHNPQPFSSLISNLDSMIQSWYSSSDLYTINGVLLRAFKDAPRQNIPHYELSDHISPVVDRAFLMQIMNCSIINDIHGTDITQDPNTQNYVIWKPYIMHNEWISHYNKASAILRVFENDVSEDDSMEMTRLLNFVDDKEVDIGPDPLTNVHMIEDCGSEIVTSVYMIQFNTHPGSGSDPYAIRIVSSNDVIVQFDAPEGLSNLAGALAMQSFRYIPPISVCTGTESTEVSFTNILGDVYNWMIYPKNDWKVLQFVAYQSLWTPKNL